MRENVPLLLSVESAGGGVYTGFPVVVLMDNITVVPFWNVFTNAEAHKILLTRSRNCQPAQQAACEGATQ
jgi:hypothetical protein